MHPFDVSNIVAQFATLFSCVSEKCYLFSDYRDRVELKQSILALNFQACPVLRNLIGSN